MPPLDPPVPATDLGATQEVKIDAVAADKAAQAADSTTPPPPVIPLDDGKKTIEEHALGHPELSDECSACKGKGERKAAKRLGPASVGIVMVDCDGCATIGRVPNWEYKALLAYHNFGIGKRLSAEEFAAAVKARRDDDRIGY